MKLLSIDVETTTTNKGNPFDINNRLVSIAWTNGTTHNCVPADDYGRHFVQKAIDRAGMLVGFNIKFDLHWLKLFGIDVSNKPIFDCQVAEYVLSRQRTKYPRLITYLQKQTLLKQNTGTRE